MKFNTNTDTSLIRHGNVVGTSNLRDLHTSLEQTDTAQTSGYRHYHRYASDTPQIREYVTKLLIVTFTWRIRSICCVAFLYMLLAYARRIGTAALWYVLVKIVAPHAASCTSCVSKNASYVYSLT